MIIILIFPGKPNFKSNHISHHMDLFDNRPRKPPRYVEELKNPVSAVLEECINDDTSKLSALRKIWSEWAGNLEGRILEELGHYWRGLAQQGLTLEEAAR